MSLFSVCPSPYRPIVIVRSIILCNVCKVSQEYGSSFSRGLSHLCPQKILDSARKKIPYVTWPNSMLSTEWISLFSFNKYQKILFHFGCWLEPEKFSNCPKKISALFDSGGMMMMMMMLVACIFVWQRNKCDIQAGVSQSVRRWRSWCRRYPKWPKLNTCYTNCQLNQRHRLQTSPSWFSSSRFDYSTSYSTRLNTLG